MPFAPGTPYRNPNATREAEERETSPSSISPTSHIPSDGGQCQMVEVEDVPLGNLYKRRQSRNLSHQGPEPHPSLIPGNDALRMKRVELQHQDNHRPGWFNPSVDLPLRHEQFEGTHGLRRPEEAHVSNPEVELHTRRYDVSRRMERDLEADVFLTRREKKEWAVLILVGSLSICGLCGLLAGLIVTL